MRTISGLLSMAVVCFVLANCQAPLVGNQTASLRFSVTSPIAATNGVATGATSARLLDSTTDQIQLRIVDPNGNLLFDKTVNRQSQDNYFFDGLPSGKGYAVTINALNNGMVLTSATKADVDLFAGKVNSVSMYLLPDPSNISVPSNSTGSVDAPFINSQYACVNYTYIFPINLYISSGNGTREANVAKLTVVDNSGKVWPTTKTTNGTYDVWTISGIPSNTGIYLVITPIQNWTISNNRANGQAVVSAQIDRL